MLDMSSFKCLWDSQNLMTNANLLSNLVNQTERNYPAIYSQLHSTLNLIPGWIDSCGYQIPFNPSSYVRNSTACYSDLQAMSSVIQDSYYNWNNYEALKPLALKGVDLAQRAMVDCERPGE